MAATVRLLVAVACCCCLSTALLLKGVTSEDEVEFSGNITEGVTSEQLHAGGLTLEARGSRLSSLIWHGTGSFLEHLQVLWEDASNITRQGASLWKACLSHILSVSAGAIANYTSEFLVVTLAPCPLAATPNLVPLADEMAEGIELNLPLSPATSATQSAMSLCGTPAEGNVTIFLFRTAPTVVSRLQVGSVEGVPLPNQKLHFHLYGPEAAAAHTVRLLPVADTSPSNACAVGTDAALCSFYNPGTLRLTVTLPSSGRYAVCMGNNGSLLVGMALVLEEVYNAVYWTTPRVPLANYRYDITVGSHSGARGAVRFIPTGTYPMVDCSDGLATQLAPEHLGSNATAVASLEHKAGVVFVCFSRDGTDAQWELFPHPLRIVQPTVIGKEHCGNPCTIDMKQLVTSETKGSHFLVKDGIAVENLLMNIEGSLTISADLNISLLEWTAGSLSAIGHRQYSVIKGFISSEPGTGERVLDSWIYCAGRLTLSGTPDQVVVSMTPAGGFENHGSLYVNGDIRRLGFNHEFYMEAPAHSYPGEQACPWCRIRNYFGARFTVGTSRAESSEVPSSVEDTDLSPFQRLARGRAACENQLTRVDLEIPLLNMGQIYFTSADVQLHYLRNSFGRLHLLNSTVSVVRGNSTNGSWELDGSLLRFTGGQQAYTTESTDFAHEETEFQGKASTVAFCSVRLDLTSASFLGFKDSSDMRVLFFEAQMVAKGNLVFEKGSYVELVSGTAYATYGSALSFHAPVLWDISRFRLRPVESDLVELDRLGLIPLDKQTADSFLPLPVVNITNIATLAGTEEPTSTGCRGHEFKPTLDLAPSGLVSFVSEPSNNSGPVCKGDSLAVPFRMETKGPVHLDGCVCFPNGGVWTAPPGEPSISSVPVTEIPVTPQAIMPNSDLSPSPAMAVAVASGVERQGGSVLFQGEHTLRCAEGEDECDVVTGLEDVAVLGKDSVVELGDGARITVENVTVMPGGRMRVSRKVELHADVDVKPDAELVTAGLNEIVKIVGDLRLNGTVVVTINQSTTCEQDPVHVDGRFSAGDKAEFACTATFWPQNGQYIPLISWGENWKDSDPPPLLTPQHCTADDRVIVRTYLDGDSKLQAQFFIQKPWVYEKQMVVGTVVGVVTLILLAIPLVRQHGFRGILRDLAKRPPVTIALPLDEFRRFGTNIAMALCQAYEILWLMFIILHPQVPMPYHFAGLQAFVHKWLYLRSTVFTAYQVLFFIVSTFVFLWVLIWFPILPATKRCSKGILHLLLGVKSKTIVARLMVTHRAFAGIGNILLLPMLTILLQVLNCVSHQEGISVLRVDTRVTCWNGLHYRMIGFSAVGSVALCILSAYSCNNLIVPLAHPPYSVDLDLRHKRTFEVLRVALLNFQVVAMAVFDHDIVPLLVSSLVIQGSYQLLVRFSAPSAYYNLNRLRSRALCVCVWGLLVALASCSSYGPYPLPSCGKIGMAFIYIYLFVSVLIVASLRRGKNAVACVVTDFSTQVLARQASVRQLHIKLQELRQMQFHRRGTFLINENNDPTDEEVSPTGGAHTLETHQQRVERTRLLLQYWRELEAFRALKERYLIPYYLGTHLPQKQNGDSTWKSSREGGYTAAEEMLSLEMEADFDGWVKGQLLGRGSYGSVYIGVLRGGGLVAVKVVELREGNTQRPKEIEKVQQEVQFIKQLRHANIIEYKACTIDYENSSINIFMEYAVGGSLTSLVKRCREPLSEEVIRLYMLQVLRGLAYLHSQGVIHRDIKGENILLDAAGTAKLADFGCARRLRTHSRLCGTQVGSPYWMAPEVISQRQGYGSEADIWSVGCTAVEALNGGNTPWKGFETVFAAMYHISSSGEQPNNIPDDISLTCRSFLDCCFERDRSKRSTAQELLAHPWVADFSTYEPNAREFVNQKSAEDQKHLDDFQTIILSGVYSLTRGSVSSQGDVCSSSSGGTEEAQSSR